MAILILTKLQLLTSQLYAYACSVYL